MNGKRLIDVIDQHVPGLFFIIFTFAIIELGILMVCVGYSSNQHILRIHNSNNELVYEDIYDEGHISEFKSISGIKDFQEEGFVLTRAAIENKFPTRAWIALSICIPLVLILFVVFIVKVFTDVFHTTKDDDEKEKDEKSKKARQDSDFEETRFENLFSILGRLNIYSLGSTVIFIGFLYWMVPDLLKYLGQISYQTIAEFKWVFLGMILFGGAYMILKAFLSYKTKNEIIKQQAEIQKNRDRLVIEAKLEKKRLEDRPDTPLT